jgi:hypothetical protein
MEQGIVAKDQLAENSVRPCELLIRRPSLVTGLAISNSDKPRAAILEKRHASSLRFGSGVAS